MGNNDSLFKAIMDKGFMDWVECYFGYDPKDIPVNNPVLKAVAAAWVKSRDTLAVTLPPIMGATSGRAGDPATILDWDDRMSEDNYEPVMIPKDVVRAILKAGIRTIGEPSGQ